MLCAATVKYAVKHLVSHWLKACLVTAILVQLAYPIYAALAAMWPYGDRSFFVFSTMVLHESLYFGVNGWFYCCDKYGWWAQYKILRTKRMIPTPELISDTLRKAIVGHFLVQPISLYVLWPLISPLGVPLRTAPLPPFMQVWLNVCLASFFNETLFYTAHRLFHTKALYRFHKIHHKYVGTIGFAAEHAHPLEQALANQFPTAFWCFFTRTHPLIWLGFLSYRLVETYEAHSGYSLAHTWLGKVGFTNGEHALFHDWHHTDNRGAFGAEWLDALMSTCVSWDVAGGKGGAHTRIGKGIVDTGSHEERGKREGVCAPSAACGSVSARKCTASIPRDEVKQVGGCDDAVAEGAGRAAVSGG